MAERLFFALWPETAQCRALTRIQSALAGGGGRCLSPQDLHLTLVFLGALEATARACAERAAEQVRGSPFDLALHRIGCFPRARVRWCGVDPCPPPLARLVADLENRLAACGLASEPRPYRPHLTLVRRAPPLETRFLARPISWPVTEFVLASRQERAPPWYRILRRWPLAS